MDGNMNPFFIMMLSSFKGNESSTLYKYVIILTIILPYISKIIPFYEIKEYFIDKFKDKNIISKTIPSHEVPVIRGFSNTPTTKIVYSKTFLSIIHYLNIHNTFFDTLTEVITLNSELTNSYDDDERRVKDNQYMYIPISNKKILINDIIYCEINDIDTKDNEDDDDKNKNKNSNKIKNIKKNNFVIILSISKKYGTEMDKLNKFINTCLEEYDLFINKKDDTKQYIYEYKSCEKTDNNIELYFDKFLMEHNKDLDVNIFFEEKSKLINYVKPFIYNPHEKYNIGEEKYKRSGFTFKAGLLFYGSPGCGKTSTIKAILKYTNRQGIIINLSKVKTCQELESIFRKRIFHGKSLEGKQLCFILEDCDAFEDNIIHSRKKEEDDKKMSEQNNGSDLIQFVKLMESSSSNVKITGTSNNDNVNLSCFLNILDGIIELHGVMIIMTTNHPEKIDEALIRPGRFDFKYEFKKASKKIIKEMLQFKFELSNSEMDRYTELMNIKDEILSPAEIQSICFKNDNIIDCIHDILLAIQK
jgi:hypothetical protein